MQKTASDSLCASRSIEDACNLQEELCWKRCAQLQEENITVMGKVVSINKGGIMVEVENLRGFVPMSHVPSVRHWANTHLI